MSQTASPQTPPDQRPTQASAETAHAPWQLDKDQQLLRHLYAQRDEQIEQLAALQRARANQKSISIVESQIAMLNHAIRHAEEQATLHTRQTEIRRVE
jgi:hypothetical protein